MRSHPADPPTYTTAHPDVSMSVAELIDSESYAHRWAARDAYDRWHLPLPGDVAAAPPEHRSAHGLRDSGGDFDPARWLSPSILDDPDHPYAYGTRVRTAVGRLFGCLYADGHPDCPRLELTQVGEQQRYLFATPDDVRRYLHLVKIAAHHVIDEGWTDPENGADDEPTPTDRRLPELCDRMLATADDAYFCERGLCARSPVTGEV